MDGEQRKPHAHRLRTGRHSEPNRIYLVTTVTYQRQPFFADFQAGRLVVDSIRIYEPSAQTLCYVIMPDHVHWMFSLGERKTLSGLVGGVKRQSAKRVNRYLQRRGKLWQSGFHDHAVRKEEDIRAIARYVVANPLRAGLVDSVGDYPLWDAVWL